MPILKNDYDNKNVLETARLPLLPGIRSHFPKNKNKIFYV